LRKLKILVVTLVMALLMASPSYAAILINQFGTVNINSNNDTTRTTETEETNVEINDQDIIVGP
jgi:hypothetical protein